jgi:hypothetical protein
MADKKTQPAYAAIVAEAEAAVAAVKDPELRRVAFDRILATLLSAEPTIAPGRQEKSRSRTKSQAPHRAEPATRARGGPKAYVEELIDDRFFDKQRSIADVRAELATRGRHVAVTSLSGPLQVLTQQRRLRRQKVAATDEGKSGYVYSNW